MGALMVRRPAAVALFPGPHALMAGVAAQLAEAAVPFVALDPKRGEAIDAVWVDRPRGVSDSVRHLAGRGRRRIAYLGPVGDRSRLDGYDAAMRALDREPLIVTVGGSVEVRANVAAAVDRLLACEPRPDAVQAYSDVTAMGVLAALHARGIRVPEDVAVVGFDDRDCAALAWPPLTTVAQPNAEVGAAAAEILLAKLAGKPRPEGGWTQILPTRLVVRESA
jgi:LacI family transcriptional regulator